MGLVLLPTAQKGTLAETAKLVHRSLLDCSIHRHSQCGHTTTKKAKPMVVHRDKVKLCLNPAACPKLWTTRPEKDQDLSDDENQMPNPDGSRLKEKQNRRDTPVVNPVENEVTNRGENDAFGEDVPQENVRPKRNAKPPAKLRDFVQTVRLTYGGQDSGRRRVVYEVK
jgi:hypothetical protein